MATIKGFEDLISWQEARILCKEVHALTLKADFAEVKSQLYRALDYKYIPKSEFDKSQTRAIKTSRLIGGFMMYVKNSDYKGNKFKVEESGVEYFTETRTQETRN